MYFIVLVCWTYVQLEGCISKYLLGKGVWCSRKLKDWISGCLIFLTNLWGANSIILLW